MRKPQVDVVFRMGEKLVSPNKKAWLEIQKDGNLVLMCQTNNNKLWSSGSCGEDVRLKIQVRTGHINSNLNFVSLNDYSTSVFYRLIS